MESGLRSVQTHTSRTELPASCVCVCVYMCVHTRVSASRCAPGVHVCAHMCRARCMCTACWLHCACTHDKCVHVCMHGSLCTCVPCTRVRARLRACVHVSPTSELEADRAGSPCRPRQAVSHPPGAELRTASWLPRSTKGIFKQAFYLSNPCYFV